MLTKKDKRMLTIAGICALLVAAFWALVYTPAVEKMKSLKGEIAVIDEEIMQIENRGGERGRDVKKMVDSIHRDFASAAQKLPSQEEDVLRFISNEANKHRLDIFSMQPSPKKPMMSSSGSTVFLDGKQCLEMTVSIQIRGGYKDLTDYIRELRENSPFLMRVEDVDIQRDNETTQRLKAKLELTLCFSS